MFQPKPGWFVRMLKKSLLKERTVSEFVELISHGDEEHRQWLRDAAEQYLQEGTVPEPRGKGTPNA